MRVLLLRANPRKTGYTQRLTDLFLTGLRAEGASVTDVDLTVLTVAQCDGCFHCWVATPGQCVHRDDMGRLLDLVLEADLLVCATPLYYYSMSSSLKTFFERTFPLAKPGLVISPRGLSRNSLRFPERWAGKKLITLISCALREPEVYRPAINTFELIAESLHLELGGQLVRPESYLLDYPLSKPKTLKRVETAFVEAGREAARSGRLSPETIAAASAPLAPSLDHFRTYSNYFWDCANAMGSNALTIAEVQKRVAGDVRILMREMVRCADPKATARVKAVLQFDFSAPPCVFRVELDRGQCTLTEIATEHADLRVACSAATWAALFTRQLDVRTALEQRQIVLEGDKSLFARLDRLFPPPSE